MPAPGGSCGSQCCTAERAAEPSSDVMRGPQLVQIPCVNADDETPLLVSAGLEQRLQLQEVLMQKMESRMAALEELVGGLRSPASEVKEEKDRTSYSGALEDQEHLNRKLDAISARINTVENLASEWDTSTRDVQQTLERVEDNSQRLQSLVHEASRASGRRGSRVTKIAKSSDDYVNHEQPVAGSVWECVLLLGTGLIPRSRELMVAVVYCNNFFFQLVFVYVLAELIDDAYVPELIESMRLWRVKYGHDVQFASADTDQPLVSIVCTGNRDVEIAGGRQADLYDELRRYQQDGGKMLTMIAVVVWWLTCSQEMIDIFHFQWSITALAFSDNSANRNIAPREREDGRIEMFNISKCRALAMFLFSSLLRLGILVCLVFFGLTYISSIKRLEEIILNAVALAFILNIDELLFDALMPESVQMAVAAMVPMRVMKGKVVRIGTFVVRWLGCIVVTGSIFFFYILPSVEVMKRVEAEMCGGSKGFVARTDLAQQYTLWVGSTDTSKEVEVARRGQEMVIARHSGVLQATVLECLRERAQSGAEACIDERIDMPPTAQSQNFVIPPEKPLASLDNQRYANDFVYDPVRVGVWRSLTTRPLPDLAAEQYCFDYDVHLWSSRGEKNSIALALAERLTPAAIEALPYNLSPLDSMACKDLQQLCKVDAAWSKAVTTGNLVRYSCPRTCGCQDPRLGTLHASSHFGCPTVCGFEYQRVLDNPAMIPCQDVPDGDPGLDEWISSYAGLSYYDAAVKNFSSHGAIPRSCKTFAPGSKSLRWASWSIGPSSPCDASTSDLWWSFHVRSVRMLCPVTCGCLSDPDARECPKACAR